MARNRKNQSAAIRFVPAVKAFLLCLLFGGSAVGYVWQKSQLHELGRQITRRELRLEQLKRENRLRAQQIADLQQPQRLHERLKAINSGLAQARPGQLVRLEEPPVRPGYLPPPSAPPLLAQQR